MLASTNTNLIIELDTLEIEDIEVFLQEGSRGVPDFAASCSTICHYLCCAPSCSCATAELPPEQMDEVLGD